MKKVYFLVISIITISVINVYADNKCISTTGCKDCVTSAAESSCKSTQEYKNWLESQNNISSSCEQQCKGIGSASAYDDCIANCTSKADSSSTTSPSTTSPGAASTSTPATTPGTTTENITTKKNGSTEANCDTLFGTNTETGKILHDIYNIIKVIVPIILLAMSIKDFGGGLLSQNDKALRDALIRFSKRLVIAILILVLPTILNFILKLLEIDTCFL